MSACLLDCLREAHLEQYFASFVQRGVTNCEDLMGLSMPDYPHFGVTTMESRVKLFKLIQIVKSVQADGIQCKHDNLKPPDVASKHLKVTRTKPVSVSTETTARMIVKSAKEKKQTSSSEALKGVEFKPGSDEPIFHCRKALDFSDLASDDEEEVAKTGDDPTKGDPNTVSVAASKPVQSITNTSVVPSIPKNSRSHAPVQPTRSQEIIPNSVRPSAVGDAPVTDWREEVKVTYLDPEPPKVNSVDRQASVLKSQYKPLKFFVDLEEPPKDVPTLTQPVSAIMLSEPKQPPATNENLVHPGKRISGMTPNSNHAYFPTRSPKEKILHRQKVYHNSGYNYGVPQGGTTTRWPTKRQDLDKICVCVRKRPMTTREVKRGDVDVVAASNGKQVTVEEQKMSVDLSAYVQEHVFTFDQVFGENSSNHDVYTSAVKPLVTCVFDRGAATCFAFGQTGSGKTHTLLGNRGAPGVYQLAAADILHMIQSTQLKDLGLKLWVSFYEIYNSQLHDLLNKRKRLFVRENGKHKVCIAGLMETQVTSLKGLTEVVRYGNASRSTGTSAANPQSSRSHAILQMEVRDGREFKVGRLSFIDLAGSERATDASSQSNKQTRMEGAEINQSLLALKECIRSLDQASQYTPYRQSKLTHILRESFTGHCRTVMIANVSPTLTASENTLNTLRYADRVKDMGRESPLKPRSLNASTRSNGFTPKKVTPVGTLFHPSNIKFSSTPKGKGTPLKATSPIPLNLSHEGLESPIHGHINRTTEKNSVNSQEKPASVDVKSSAEDSTRSEDDIIREHQEIMTHLDVVLDKAKSVMQKTNALATESSQISEEEEEEKEESEDKATSSLETARTVLRDLRVSGQPMQAKRFANRARFKQQSAESKSQPDVRSSEDKKPEDVPEEKGGLLNMLRAKEKTSSSSDRATAIRRWHLSDPFPVGLRRGPAKRSERTQSTEEASNEKHVLKSLTEIRKLQSQQKANKEAESSASRSLGDERPFPDLLASPSNTRRDSTGSEGRPLPILLLKPSDVEALKTQTIVDVVKSEEAVIPEVTDSGISSAEGPLKSHVTFVDPEEDDRSEASTLHEIPPLPDPFSTSPQNSLSVHSDSAFTKVSVSSQEIDQIRQNALSQGLVLSDTSGNSSVEYKRSPVRSSERSKMNAEDAIFSPIVAFPVTAGEPQQITIPSVTKLEISDDHSSEESPPACLPTVPVTRNASRTLEKQLKALKEEETELPGTACVQSSSSSESLSENYGDDVALKAQSCLLTAHEDQLSSTTSMCKQEMQLLLQVQQGHKDFDDYVRDLQVILLSKLHSVSNLHSQIKTFYTHLSKS